ncbi:MAG: hypothetical protein IPG32_06520 [Saprospirales bacterium]|nr:hypothetical protein [Saprospirales bacterium]
MDFYDLVLLTEIRFENPPNPNWYVQQILGEDRLLGDALERRGLRVRRVDWARKDFDWSSSRMAMFRTTWNYFNRFAEFTEWLERVERQTRLLNAPELIRWNIDKHYLRDLEQRGIHIVPTRFVEIGEEITLGNLRAESGWDYAVLKPAVSGAARHTYRLHPDNFSEHEEVFRQLLASEAMLYQPFQENIAREGEKSLMVMGGQYTHAVLKKAKTGDFRVQDDFGGTVQPYQPTAEEIAFAEKVFAVCDPMPLYGRVDFVTDNEGQLAVVELEIIEPELWFRHHPPAAEVLADVLLGLF